MKICPISTGQRMRATQSMEYDLRRDELIGSHGRFVVIRDWARLRAAGDFEEAYLHLKDRDTAPDEARLALRAI